MGMFRERSWKSGVLGRVIVNAVMALTNIVVYILWSIC